MRERRKGAPSNLLSAGQEHGEQGSLSVQSVFGLVQQMVVPSKRRCCWRSGRGAAWTRRCWRPFAPRSSTSVNRRGNDVLGVTLSGVEGSLLVPGHLCDGIAARLACSAMRDTRPGSARNGNLTRRRRSLESGQESRCLKHGRHS